MSEEKRRLICTISRLQEVEFKTFREIAAELGISKSWACELYKKWTPAMVSTLPDEGSNTTGRERVSSDGDAAGADQQSSPPYQTAPSAQSGGHPSSNQEGSTDHPQPPARRSIHDLTLGHDGYGREIRIETRCHHTGRPAVWYQLDKKGQKRRFTRDTLGIHVEHLDAGPFL